MIRKKPNVRLRVESGQAKPPDIQLLSGGGPGQLQRCPASKFACYNFQIKFEQVAAVMEPLHCDRLGQHSIRIDKQFWVCFRWTKAGAEDVLEDQLKNIRPWSAESEIGDRA